MAILHKTNIYQFKYERVGKTFLTRMPKQKVQWQMVNYPPIHFMYKTSKSNYIN